MVRRHPGYDSRPNRKIGAGVETLPEVLNGIRRVQGWLEVCAANGVAIPHKNLRDLLTVIDKVIQQQRAGGGHALFMDKPDHFVDSWSKDYGKPEQG